MPKKDGEMGGENEPQMDADRRGFLTLAGGAGGQMNRRSACAEASACAKTTADKSADRWTRMDADGRLLAGRSPRGDMDRIKSFSEEPARVQAHLFTLVCPPEAAH
jgi:hypothetical protein